MNSGFLRMQAGLKCGTFPREFSLELFELDLRILRPERKETLQIGSLTIKRQSVLLTTPASSSSALVSHRNRSTQTTLK